MMPPFTRISIIGCAALDQSNFTASTSKDRLHLHKMLKPIVITTLFLVCFLWERTLPFAKENRSSLWVNLSLGFVSFSVTSALTVFFLGTAPLNLTSITTQSVPLLLFTVVFLDGVSYLWHRAAHKIDFLWALHKVHHTEERMESTSAFRFHVLEVLLSLIPRYGLVAILDLPLISVMIFEVLFQFCNIFQHSNIKLSTGIEEKLQYLLVTPALHKNHHSIDQARQNTNFSTIFSFWDRGASTFQKSIDTTPFKLGLSDQTSQPSFVSLLFLRR